MGLGTHIGLILVYLGGSIGFNSWLIKGFMDTISPSLDEAAKVDGATDFQIFRRIIAPLSRPILVVSFCHYIYRNLFRLHTCRYILKR